MSGGAFELPLTSGLSKQSPIEKVGLQYGKPSDVTCYSTRFTPMVGIPFQMYIEKRSSHQSASLLSLEYPSRRFANPGEGAAAFGGSIMVTLLSAKVQDSGGGPELGFSVPSAAAFS